VHVQVRFTALADEEVVVLGFVGAIRQFNYGIWNGANTFLREFKTSRERLAVFIVFIAATGAVETYRYFSFWASNPNTAAAFNEKYVEIGHYLTSLPADESRFVIVNARGVLVPHTNPEGSQEPSHEFRTRPLRNPRRSSSHLVPA
jgi:hypothetical protein